MTRELKGLEEGPKTEIHIDLLKTTLKRISNWKTPSHDGIHGLWFKKFTSIHGRLTLEMNRRLQGAQEYTVRIYSQDIGMEFGIEKLCHARHEKWQTT